MEEQEGEKENDEQVVEKEDEEDGEDGAPLADLLYFLLFFLPFGCCTFATLFASTPGIKKTTFCTIFVDSKTQGKSSPLFE